MTNNKNKENCHLIYKHTSPSGKSYIGQTNNLQKRNSQHKTSEKCAAFSSAIKKYGWDAFTHEVLMKDLTIDEANHWEKFYVDFYNSISPNGYNLMDGGFNSLHSPESIEKIKKIHAGKAISEQARKNMSIAQTGKKRSPESVAKTAAANTGKKRTNEQKETMSKAAQGRTLLPHVKDALLQANKGRKHSPEHIEKRASIHRGKVTSDETKKKMSEAAKGRVMSQESREKMKISQKKRFERERLERENEKNE